MRLTKTFSAALLFCAMNSHALQSGDATQLKAEIDAVMLPLMQAHQIPGLAVAVTLGGKQHIYNYGITSKATRQPVDQQTLFEIGSLSKTFTATLATYAQVKGQLVLTDSASKYMRALQGSSFDNIRLLDLGTHTSGGLPLQVPDGITNTAELTSYFQRWKATYPAGSYRTYSNPSIGLLGVITAQSMQQPFEDALEKTLFPALGMAHSYIRVPAQQSVNYAQGYTRKDLPVRLNPGVLASEAYGVKSTAADLIRFVEANMQLHPLAPDLQRAIDDTHVGYYKVGEMTQGLIWEQYAYPVSLSALLAGNADAMALEAMPVTRLVPAQPPQASAWINKTGSTNGFGAYAAFVPAKKIGIVMLANKNYPNDARIRAAYKVLERLAN